MRLSSRIGDTIYVEEIEKYGPEQLIALVAHGDIDYAVCDESIPVPQPTVFLSLFETIQPCVEAVQQDRGLFVYPPGIELREADGGIEYNAL